MTRQLHADSTHSSCAVLPSLLLGSAFRVHGVLQVRLFGCTPRLGQDCQSEGQTAKSPRSEAAYSCGKPLQPSRFEVPAEQELHAKE